MYENTTVSAGRCAHATALLPLGRQLINDCTGVNMSLPSVPAPNSEPSSPIREDQPRCRKRTFLTTSGGPTEARVVGPSGAASCGGSLETIPRGADRNNDSDSNSDSEAQCPEGINGESHRHFKCCPLHGIDHSTDTTACPQLRYHIYDVNIRDPRHPKYIRGPFPDEIHPHGLCRCLPLEWCTRHAWFVLDRTAEEKQKEAQRQRRARSHEEAYVPDWQVAFLQNRPRNLLEMTGPWERCGEDMGRRHGPPAREMLYRFYSFCILNPGTLIAKFDMTYEDYVSDTRTLNRHAIREIEVEAAQRRTRKLAVFIDNNPWFFDSTRNGQELIRQIARETSSVGLDPDLYRTFLL